jgi:hypothetical protein
MEKGSGNNFLEKGAKPNRNVGLCCFEKIKWVIFVKK